MKGNPVRWFEIYVKEMSRAKRFYEGVFGVTLEKLEGPVGEYWTFPSDKDAFGSSGALAKIDHVVPSGGCGTLVYFGSEDCSLEEKRIAQFGGKVERPKSSIGPYGFITLAFDTEGNMFGIHSMK